MAIYHASVKSFSRKDGQSSVAAAAYRAGINITCETTGETHKYSRRKGVASHHMLAPPAAPSWCLDAKAFWSANEAAETRKNARLGRELEFSLPSELDEGQREKLALAVGQMLVDRYHVVVMAAIHEPGKEGDNRNHHVHLLMSAREVGPHGLGDRAAKVLDERMGVGPNEIRALREQVALITNAHLKAAGIHERIDHRTLKAQAEEAEAKGDFAKAAMLTRTPTKHMGKAVTARTRRGLENDRAWHRSHTIIDNRMLLRDYLDKAEREARLQPSSPFHCHIAALAERQREAGEERKQHAQARLPLDRFVQQLDEQAKSMAAKPLDEANVFRKGGTVDPWAAPEKKVPSVDELYAREFEAVNKAFDLEQLRPPRETERSGGSGDVMATPLKSEEILPPPPKPDIEVPPPKGEIDIAKVFARGGGKKPRSGGGGRANVATSRTRLARSTGPGSEILNAQAEQIEQWLAAQDEAARAYLASLQSMGQVPEIQFTEAHEAINITRMAAYWHRPMLREDIASLAQSCEVYACASTRRARREEDARRAQAHLSEVRVDINQQLLANPYPGSTASRKEIKAWGKWHEGLQKTLLGAGREFAKAKRALDPDYLRKYEKALGLARMEMVDQTQRIERIYPVPVPPELEDDLRHFKFPSGPTHPRVSDGPSPLAPTPKPERSRYLRLRPPK